MKNVRHFGIVVSDLERSIKFYTELLGLKIEKQSYETEGHITNMLALPAAIVTTVKMSADEGQTLVELLYFHNPKSKPEQAPGPTKIGPTHIAFTVSNLDEIYKRLKEAGVQFNCSVQFPSNGFAKVTFCKDPDGTLIELVQEL